MKLILGVVLLVVGWRLEVGGSLGVGVGTPQGMSSFDAIFRKHWIFVGESSQIKWIRVIMKSEAANSKLLWGFQHF
jgi:hypothetical protein